MSRPLDVPELMKLIEQLTKRIERLESRLVRTNFERPEVIVFSWGGLLISTDRSVPWYFEDPGEITLVDVGLRVAGTTPTTVRFYKNGTQAIEVVVPAGRKRLRSTISGVDTLENDEWTLATTTIGAGAESISIKVKKS